MVISIFQEANSFAEYTFPVYMVSASAAIGAALATIAFRTKAFCAYIDNRERTIDESMRRFPSISKSEFHSNLTKK